MFGPRIKICCIANEQEAADAISCGASAIGLVGNMPSGPGPISDEEILRIASAVPPPIATFLLTSEQTAQGIIDHHHRTETNTIQIVDELEDRDYSAIRAALPGVKLVQVIHVIGERSNCSIVDAQRKASIAGVVGVDPYDPTTDFQEPRSIERG